MSKAAVVAERSVIWSEQTSSAAELAAIDPNYLTCDST